ncbi:type VII secretion protein EccE [Solwaraspora sp. WMMD1047]|uniref:type VII secretion protein EccE n=1 Tax=Solwaraspora sp. WMMD1047 TaxID=3016102 RepID=UPI00241689DB|nr:type VII secretion protein EccE [Solwaraspora sp. WMMD1047]MDG4831863.1 type VII secretion protein EccE [Solwaraspora sp. WMMD1047]
MTAPRHIVTAAVRPGPVVPPVRRPPAQPARPAARLAPHPAAPHPARPAPHPARPAAVAVRPGSATRVGRQQRVAAVPLSRRLIGHLPRIACWQLCAVLVLLSLGRPWPVAVPLVAAGTALGALSGARVRGHWLSSVAVRRARLLRRRRRYRLPGTIDRPALLAALAPAARISDPADPAIGDTSTGGASTGGASTGGASTGGASTGGTSIGSTASGSTAGGGRAGGGLAASGGLISRPEGLLTVLRPDPDRGGDLMRLACSDSLRPDPEDRTSRAGLRLLLHRDQGRAPRCWLVVGVRRDADSAEDHELRAALDNGVRRLRRRSRQAGLDLHPLPAAELLQMLSEVTHTGPGRDRLDEQWRHWHAGPVAQVGLALSGPDVRPERRAELLDRLLAGVPQAAATVAVAVDRPGLTGVLRLAARTAPVVDLAADRCGPLGRELGVHLERLDGRHGPAVAASSPIGGDLS